MIKIYLCIILCVVCLGLGVLAAYFIFAYVANRNKDGAYNKARKIVEEAHKEAEGIVEAAETKAKKTLNDADEKGLVLIKKLKE